MKNFASLFPSYTRRNDTNTHNALFSKKALFLLSETGRTNGYSQHCKLVLDAVPGTMYKMDMMYKVMVGACLPLINAQLSHAANSQRVAAQGGPLYVNSGPFL